jgi:hypothetical protein
MSEPTGPSGNFATGLGSLYVTNLIMSWISQ